MLPAILNSWCIKYLYVNGHIPLFTRFLRSVIKNLHSVFFPLIRKLKHGICCELNGGRSSCYGGFGLQRDSKAKYYWDMVYV